MMGSLSSFFDFDDKAIFTALKGNPMIRRFVDIERGDVQTDLMKGNFNFQNMDLNSEGFERLAPVRFIQGFIEKAEIKMPFGKMDKEPMVCEMSGLFILFGPVEAGTWKKTKLKIAKKKNTLILNIVRKVIARVKAEVAAAGYPVINKARFNLEDIHIRFEIKNEDGTTSAEGLILKAASIEPTNSTHAAACSDAKARANGEEPTHVDGKAQAEPDLRKGADVTKTVEYKGLGMYCDLNVEPIKLGDVQDGLAFTAQMKQLMSAPHTYVVEPQGAASDITLGMTMSEAAKIKINDFHVSWRFLPIIGVVHKPLAKKFLEVLRKVSQGRNRDPTSTDSEDEDASPGSRFGSFQRSFMLSSLEGVGLVQSKRAGDRKEAAGSNPTDDMSKPQLRRRVEDLEGMLAEKVVQHLGQLRTIEELEAELAVQAQRGKQLLDEIDAMKGRRQASGCVPNSMFCRGDRTDRGGEAASTAGPPNDEDGDGLETEVNPADTDTLLPCESEKGLLVSTINVDLGGAGVSTPGVAANVGAAASSGASVLGTGVGSLTGAGVNAMNVGMGTGVGALKDAGMGKGVEALSAGFGQGMALKDRGVGVGTGVIGAGVGAVGKRLGAAGGKTQQSNGSPAPGVLAETVSTDKAPTRNMELAEAQRVRGMLRKRASGGLRARWQSRWFKVEDGGRALLYFAEKGTAEPKGRIPLDGCSVCRMGGGALTEGGVDGDSDSQAVKDSPQPPPSPSKHDHCFELTHPDASRRQLQLRAESAGQMRHWMLAITALIRDCDTADGSSTSHDPAGGGAESEKVGRTLADAMASSKAADEGDRGKHSSDVSLHAQAHAHPRDHGISGFVDSLATPTAD
jgi:hypothetical protein